MKSEGRRFSYFVMALLLLAVGGKALSQETARAKKKKEPLKAELTTPAAALCPGGSIALEMQLTNESQETIRIDETDLWSSFSYGRTLVVGPDGELLKPGGGGGMGSSCGNCRGDYIVISPGETFWTKHSFKLEGNFFNEAQKYTLRTQVKYELADKQGLSVDSNEIEFELFECTSK
jgi:hypothetical protein